ncbi:hypothetical protein CRG98_045346 [Punica granatum]|uniref:Uncharacterized protein n=1 Tax=Punica granatum TaxID=22663 RepID=A0A2I0HR99_PUNGR|nr:hypothetical protein CRG98_045346 [Punica granatum]
MAVKYAYVANNNTLGCPYPYFASSPFSTSSLKTRIPKSLRKKHKPSTSSPAAATSSAAIPSGSTASTKPRSSTASWASPPTCKVTRSILCHSLLFEIYRHSAMFRDVLWW